MTPTSSETLPFDLVGLTVKWKLVGLLLSCGHNVQFTTIGVSRLPLNLTDGSCFTAHIQGDLPQPGTSLIST